MGLLTKLKSLLGLDEDRSQVRRGETGVTIEREPDESAEPDAEAESAVKSVDTGSEESFDTEATDEADTVDAESDAETAETGVSTEDVTSTPEDEGADPGPQAAAEPAEATQPSVDASEPDQSARDEPEPTPEETGLSEKRISRWIERAQAR